MYLHRLGQKPCLEDSCKVENGTVNQKSLTFFDLSAQT